MVTKTFKFLCCFFLVLPFIFFIGGGDGVEVSAQEKRSLLEKLFGRKKPAEIAPVQIDRQRTPKRARQPVRARKSPTNSLSQARREEKKPPIAKSDQAKRVLVIGDFIAAAVADGLTRSYLDNPNLVIVKHINVSSGLVRDDYYNWSAKATQIISSEKPDMILVAMGGNDRQAFRMGKNMLAFGEAEWSQHYQSRIDRLSEQLQNSKIPWGWVGLPPFKKPTLNQSATLFNSLYKNNAEKHGATFIDIWDGFVDEDGNFSFSGYDVDGQTARLRNNDGINFTAAGYRKLAFYADTMVRTLLEDIVPPPAEEMQAHTPDTPISAPVLSRHIDRVAPIGLWDIGRGGGATTLAGGRQTEKNSHDRGQNANVSLSQKLRSQAGRADYFIVTSP